MRVLGPTQDTDSQTAGPGAFAQADSAEVPGSHRTRKGPELQGQPRCQVALQV